MMSRVLLLVRRVYRRPSEHTCTQLCIALYFLFELGSEVRAYIMLSWTAMTIKMIPEYV